MTEPDPDHLTALPSELIHLIVAYLFPPHFPDKAFFAPPPTHQQNCSHPLDCLAATCRTLRLEVNAWARHFLIHHQPITKFKTPPVAPKKSQNHVAFSPNYLRNPRHHSRGLLSWSENKCVFCGKSSSRSAILMNGLRCCDACDKQQWPRKITKTQALREYHLKEHHLLPHKQPSGKLMSKVLADLGIPPLRYGTYFSANVPTTMFARDDVEALAQMVHGDLKAHLKQRSLAREKRKANVVVNKEKRLEQVKKEADDARRNAARAAMERAQMQDLVVLSDDADDHHDNDDDEEEEYGDDVIVLDD